MGLKAEAKEYYESENQRRVLHIMNLSQFLSKLNDQVLKLPHEIIDNSVARPTGCTNEDIIDSIERGVSMAYVLASPAREILANKKGVLQEFVPKDQTKYDAKSKFDRAMEKLEWIYLLLEEADWLNDRLISDSLPGDEETYDYGGGSNEATNERSMPASVPITDDKAVGAVEEENKQSVA